MLPQLSRYIMDNWAVLFPRIERQNKLTYLGITGSVEAGTSTFLAFPDESEKPAFVVKIARVPDRTGQIVRERDVLLFLESLGSSLANSVPKVILCEKIAGAWVLVESVLDGKPMMVIMSGDGLPDVENAGTNLYLARKWLVDLNKETKETWILAGKPFEDYVRKQIEKFLSIFVLSKYEEDFVRDVVGMMASFAHREIDLFLSHGDFCRHNILISKSKTAYNIGVIDWASSRRANLPVHDFFFFLTTYFLQVRTKHGLLGYAKAFEDTFFNKSKYSDLVRQCLIEYCGELKIDLSLTRSLFVLFVLDKAVTEYERLVSLSQRGFIPRFGIDWEWSRKKSYREALKEQMWLLLFRILVREQGRFII